MVLHHAHARGLVDVLLGKTHLKLLLLGFVLGVTVTVSSAGTGARRRDSAHEFINLLFLRRLLQLLYLLPLECILLEHGELSRRAIPVVWKCLFFLAGFSAGLPGGGLRFARVSRYRSHSYQPCHVL